MDKKILDQFIIEMISLLQNAKQFAQDQIPQFAKEVLTYYLWKELISVLFLILIIGILIYIKLFLIKKIKETHEDDPELMFICILCLGCFFFILLGFGFGLKFKVDDLLKIILAPKVFLIDYLRGCLK